MFVFVFVTVQVSLATIEQALLQRHVGEEVEYDEIKTVRRKNRLAYIQKQRSGSTGGQPPEFQRSFGRNDGGDTDQSAVQTQLAQPFSWR